MSNSPYSTITEFTATRTVKCANELCQRFEQDIELELLVENIDGHLEQFSFVCTECDHRNEIEIEITNPESYYYEDNYEKDYS
jgi:hypothetical protein